MPAQIQDDTLPEPQGSYGTQKFICELLCYEYNRRGWIDARIVRGFCLLCCMLMKCRSAFRLSSSGEAYYALHPSTQSW